MLATEVCSLLFNNINVLIHCIFYFLHGNQLGNEVYSVGLLKFISFNGVY